MTWKKITVDVNWNTCTHHKTIMSSSRAAQNLNALFCTSKSQYCNHFQGNRKQTWIMVCTTIYPKFIYNTPTVYLQQYTQYFFPFQWVQLNWSKTIHKVCQPMNLLGWTAIGNVTWRWKFTWWFIMARKHIMQTWTSSLASPMFNLDILVWRGEPIVLDRFSFLAGLLTRPSKLVLFSLFNSCSFLQCSTHNEYFTHNNTFGQALHRHSINFVTSNWFCHHFHSYKDSQPTLLDNNKTWCSPPPGGRFKWNSTFNKRNLQYKSNVQ